MTKAKRDFTEGPLFCKIFLFALPIMLTGILQVFYNMADSMIVGKFSGDPNALAAVGSTSSLNNLLVNLIMGTAVGAGIVISQFYGAKRYEDVSKSAHTAMTFSIIAGLSVAIIGFIFAPYLLSLIGIREEIIDKSTLYLRIIMCGVPASSVYNYGASILRSIGDSKTPLFILSGSGLLNVGLNIVFVICFNMTVDGVALATIISQYLSASLIIFILIRRKNECYSINIKQLKIHSYALKRMLRIGIPSGLQSCMFSIANIFIISSVNTFPTTTVSAYSIANNIDGVTYTSMNCFQQAAMTFTGQNYGANKKDRVKKVLIYSLIQVFLIGFLISRIELLLAEPIVSLFISTDDLNRDIVISTTVEIMTVLLTFYFSCGMMEVFAGSLRGFGCSITPMIVSLAGAFVVRLIWIYAIFFPSESMNSIGELLYAFPISWFLTMLAHAITLMIFWKKFGIFKKSEKTTQANENSN